MPKDNLVLVDTSVWIDYLSVKTNGSPKTLDHLLEQGLAASAAIIMAELVQGARNEKEINKLRDYFQPLHWIESSDRHWEEAGSLSFHLKRAGRNINLTDCYIARLAQGAGASVFSLDKHFVWIAESDGCRLFS